MKAAACTETIHMKVCPRRVLLLFNAHQGTLVTHVPYVADRQVRTVSSCCSTAETEVEESLACGGRPSGACVAFRHRLSSKSHRHRTRACLSMRSGKHVSLHGNGRDRDHVHSLPSNGHVIQANQSVCAAQTVAKDYLGLSNCAPQWHIHEMHLACL